MKITRKIKMNEIINKNEEAIKILSEAGMGCFGCPMAMQETLENGCLAHGMSKKQVDEIIEKLNKREKKK